MFYSKILICAAEIQKLKPEFKPVLSSLTYLIHVHLFIYHLHPQFSSPGHSHQAGHLWRGISHSQRAMADGGFGMWFLWFLSWNNVFFGVLGRPESENHSDSTSFEILGRLNQKWEMLHQKNHDFLRKMVSAFTPYYCGKLSSQCYKYNWCSRWRHKAWHVLEMRIVHNVHCLFPGSLQQPLLKDAMKWC